MTVLAGLVCLQQLACKTLDLDEMHATRSQRNYQQQQNGGNKNLKLTEKGHKQEN